MDSTPCFCSTNNSFIRWRIAETNPPNKRSSLIVTSSLKYVLMGIPELCKIKTAIGFSSLGAANFLDSFFKIVEIGLISSIKSITPSSWILSSWFSIADLTCSILY